MKKIISMLLVITMLITTTAIFPLTVSAANEPALTVANVEGTIGSTVNVTIALSNNPGLIAIGMKVVFDNDCLTLGAVTDGGLFPPGSMVAGNSRVSPYTINFDDSLASADSTANGTLVTLPFTIVSVPADGVIPISIQAGVQAYGLAFMPDGVTIDPMNTTPVTLSTVSGGITVASNTVTFDENGGEAVTPNTREVFNGLKYGTHGDLPATTRTGYEYLGWYTGTDDGQLVTSSTDVLLTDDQTLFARWRANTYTVTFNANGGTTDPDSTEVTYDATYGELPLPSLTGHDFDGWFTAAEGGTEVTSTTKVTITDDQTLFAHWSLSEYNVTFDSNGGSTPDPESKLVTYNTAYGTLPSVTMTGYSFDGWFTAETGGTKITETTVFTGTDIQTLFAHWTAKTYTLSYNANGSTVTPTSKTVTYDAAIGTLPDPAARTGYDFAGWYTGATGGTVVTKDTIVAFTADTTIYAHWTAKTYTVTLNANSGTVTPASIEVTYGGAYANLPVPTRSGYGFDGWFTAATGGTEVETTTAVAITSDQTLFAHWTAKRYTVSFNSNGGSIPDPASKQVAYDAAYGTLPDVSRYGYEFDGWFTGSTGGTMITDSTVFTATSDQTLYAHWTAKTYTISYNANGGSGAPAPQTKTHDTGLVLSRTKPTRTNFYFAGWALSEQATTADYPAGATYTREGDATLYAVWSDTPLSCTVSYDANGGAGAPAAQIKDFEVVLTLSAVRPKLSGHVFLGWSLDSTATSPTYQPGGEFDLDEDVTLYAVWQKTTTPPTSPTVVPGGTITTTVTTAPTIAQLSKKVVRISGSDRFATSAMISSATFDRSDSVILASGTNYADALAGVPLAYALNAPILLVSGESVSASVMAEINRLGVGSIYILGGTSAVSASIENTLGAGRTVIRISGEDRFGTSALIAERLTRLCGAPSEVFVAYSGNYPDALAISPVAAMTGCPILYADGSGRLDSAVSSYLDNTGCGKATILGGTSAVPAATESALSAAGVTAVTRIGGSDRYDTMLRINNAYSGLFTGNGICAATGTNYPDALTGGVFAAKNRMPIVLLPAGNVSASLAAAYAASRDVATLYVFGGESAISAAEAAAVAR